jgi:hypothetical protein
MVKTIVDHADHEKGMNALLQLSCRGAVNEGMNELRRKKWRA